MHVLHEHPLLPTELIAVGGEAFVRGIKECLGMGAKGRKVVRGESGVELRILAWSDPNKNRDTNAH
jgi:hypothetical protein